MSCNDAGEALQLSEVGIDHSRCSISRRGAWFVDSIIFTSRLIGEYLVAANRDEWRGQLYHSLFLQLH